jgi:hypothetical protein
VKVLLARLEHMLLNVEERMTIKRTYVVKAVDKDGIISWRPIGNPAYPDRMFLYIWQSFFVIYINSFISKSQHAYRPGQGVLTAIKEIKSIIEDSNYKYINEFDLKGAFPSVAITPTCQSLAACGLPSQISDFIMLLSIKTVEVVDRCKQRLPEYKFDRQEKLSRGMIYSAMQNGNLNPYIEAARRQSLIKAKWTR